MDEVGFMGLDAITLVVIVSKSGILEEEKSVCSTWFASYWSNMSTRIAQHWKRSKIQGRYARGQSDILPATKSIGDT